MYSWPRHWYGRDVDNGDSPFAHKFDIDKIIQAQQNLLNDGGGPNNESIHSRLEQLQLHERTHQMYANGKAQEEKPYVPLLALHGHCDGSLSSRLHVSTKRRQMRAVISGSSLSKLGSKNHTLVVHSRRSVILGTVLRHTLS